MNQVFSPGVLFLLISVLIIALVGVIYLTIGRRSVRTLDKRKFQAKWLAIENGLERSNSASWQVAVFGADKLLDDALRGCKYPGQTMGERMKAAAAVWKSPGDVWQAHKVRNRLAHESDARLDYKLTVRALSAYKRALKDMGAL